MVQATEAAILETPIAQICTAVGTVQPQQSDSILLIAK